MQLELKVLVGSQAYGTAGPDSDCDYAGFYVAPTADFWKVDSKPAETVRVNADFTAHEIGKLCRLLCTGNPTANEALWAPVIEATPIGDYVRGFRSQFLSRRCIGAYLGYATQQRHKINLRAQAGDTMDANHHSRSWKNAAHVLRLCIAGRHLMETGDVLVYCGNDADRIRSIRRGELPVADVLGQLDHELAMLEAAAKDTALPALPDFDAINHMMRVIRLESVRKATQ